MHATLLRVMHVIRRAQVNDLVGTDGQQLRAHVFPGIHPDILLELESLLLGVKHDVARWVKNMKGTAKQLEHLLADQIIGVMKLG